MPTSPFVLPKDLAVDQQLFDLIERYRATYLDYFLSGFDAAKAVGHRGGFFNINSVTARPYAHHLCYSWTDGRALGEFCAARLAGQGDAGRLDAYADHLHDVLVERWDRNGYYPHVVDDATNRAADDPMNAKLGTGQSSFSHIFVLNGYLQYALLRDSAEAWGRGMALLQDLTASLRDDRFLEGAAPRPAGHRAQGPFMIALGACTDILESLAALHGTGTAPFAERAAPFLDLGRTCVDYILAHHLRRSDFAFWEVSDGGEGVRNEDGHVITDPGHTIEFTGFAGRFAAFLPQDEASALRDTARRIFLWAAGVGFHAERDLVYRNVDRDTGAPIDDVEVDDIEARVSPEVYDLHFRDRPGPVRLATYPWWVPMELIAAAGVLRQDDDSGDDTGRVDACLLRAVRGVFTYYLNPRLGWLCYQNIGDGFFQYLDVPPATLSLDLMHSHRSMRIFLRETATVS